MNMQVDIPADAEANRILKLACLAVGGQGGGVLTDWIVAVAEANGYVAQSTSVAGVAQRTGATIYYVEMTRHTDRLPVFSLSPSEGDVDILISAELMEAGRSVMRGFVTPDRTTLIASSHRIAAVSEKIEPGDGRANSEEVLTACSLAAKRLVAFDMETMAVQAGSVISASLLGALAGSGALPFAREGYEEVIRASGRGVEASLRAFTLAYERAMRRDESGDVIEMVAVDAPAALPAIRGPEAMLKKWQALEARVQAMPAPVAEIALRGLRKVVDFQDLAYGAEYLDRLDKALALEPAARDHALSFAAAKHLANAMCYDDIIRVADLKTRAHRFARVRKEVGVREENVLQLTEYFHPRAEEFCGTLPAFLGAAIEKRPKLFAWVDRRLNKGRRIRTDSARGFAMLWLVGGLRPVRRRLLRHRVERAHLEEWYALALATVASDYALAVEILNCRRLIKGYSDTHVRGQSKYARVIGALDMLRGRDDAADWLRRLREAALKDEKGVQLDGALKTVASFA
ncbi:indolepyruvate oxidoreductase subunit beta family protein [Paroceanicella profunda]|uniref:Indolepyruvate oxidoreductase subunit beta family protein n=1 Tax=Paroceanicella profunda TaxID=2579971 RepID=A0A5B8G260_9RHOB|nr:indolepyruvate oxidoreductase subunit beta family protein [Paroceanicella profunda]QDL92673.1 indolepyruvate oxidoreductase subunit beta family protein [Paroceanicella profunda]